MLSRMMCLAKDILRWSEQLLLINKRLHSFKHYFCKDPVEIRRDSNRPIIVNVCVIILLENRNNLCHF